MDGKATIDRDGHPVAARAYTLASTAAAPPPLALMLLASIAAAPPTLALAVALRGLQAHLSPSMEATAVALIEPLFVPILPSLVQLLLPIPIIRHCALTAETAWTLPDTYIGFATWAKALQVVPASPKL